MSKNASELASVFINKEKDREEFKQSFEVVNPAHITAFRGMFGETKLSEDEEQSLKNILSTNIVPGEGKEEDLNDDLKMIKQITSEIKAISNQSILLHGERIKKAQNILRRYRDGAFTDWLMSTYGNRQTPYSMLQYFELYHSLPLDKRQQLEKMPKKAVYTLASRNGEIQHKIEIIEKYKGEKQSDMIALIQEKFPIPERDLRAKSINETLLDDIEKLVNKLDKRSKKLEKKDKTRIQNIILMLTSLSSGLNQP